MTFAQRTSSSLVNIGNQTVNIPEPLDVTFPSPQEVTVGNTVSVDVTNTTAIDVTVSNIPEVTVSGTPNVAVTNIPDVTISGTPDVNVVNVPSVTVGNTSGSPVPVHFPSTPSVNVANTPSVTVSGTPNVAVTNTPSVTVSGTPTVTVGNSILTVSDPSLRRTAFGELLVGQLQPKAAWRFDYGSTPNNRIVSTTTATGGTVTVVNSKAVLTTSANAAGSATMRTIAPLRYLNGIGGLARFTGVFTTGVANSRQLIGIGDAVDGFFIGYVGNAFGIVRRRNSTDDFVASTSWNGTAVTFNPTLGNVFQIRYQWLGYGFIRFYVLDPSDQANGFTLVHTINYPNTSPDVSILNPTLPLWAEAINTGNTSSLVLQTPSGVAFSEGATSDTSLNPLDIYRSFDNTATFNNTNVNHLTTIRNKATYGGTANRMPVVIREITIARGASGANLSRFRVYKNAATAGTLTFVDVDTNNSPVDTSITTTTVTTATSLAERTYALSTADTLSHFDFLEGEIVLQPGESLTVAVDNSQNISTETIVSVAWCEQF
jgi:hypothetical protein